jgi:hypothetical protein
MGGIGRSRWQSGSRPTSAGIKQPVAHEPGDFVAPPLVRGWVETLAAHNEVSDVVSRKVLEEVIDREAGIAVAGLRTQFVKQGFASRPRPITHVVSFPDRAPRPRDNAWSVQAAAG